MADRPLLYTDFSTIRFTCSATGRIESSVASDNTIDGTGSTANPLTITPSTDIYNIITTGTDGRLYATPGSLPFIFSQPVMDYPDTPQQGWIINLIGHPTDPNGYYYFDGVNWNILGSSGTTFSLINLIAQNSWPLFPVEGDIIRIKNHADPDVQDGLYYRGTSSWIPVATGG